MDWRRCCRVTRRCTPRWDDAWPRAAIRSGRQVLRTSSRAAAEGRRAPSLLGMVRGFVGREHRLPRVRELIAQRVAHLPYDAATNVEKPAARQLVETDAAHEHDIGAGYEGSSGDERFDIE